METNSKKERKARRAISAREKAQGFLGANEQLVTAYESLDATARQEVQVKLAFCPFLQTSRCFQGCA